MSKKHLRWKIYRDEVKERLTNHWDLDYMSAETVAEEYSKPKMIDEGTGEEPIEQTSLLQRLRTFVFGGR